MGRRHEPTIPEYNGGLLAAWQPWQYAGAAINLLAANEFEADDPFWPVYYTAGISLLDTVRDTLRKIDAKKYSSSSHIFQGFENWLKPRRKKENRPHQLPDIFWDFIHSERNDQLHEFGSKAATHRVSTRPFLWDGDAEKVRSGISLFFDDDDALRLFGHAFQWAEETLRLIDQAVFEEVSFNPFGETTHKHRLEERSYQRIKTGRLDFNF